EVKRLLAGLSGTASAASGVTEAQGALQGAQDELDAQIGALTAARLLTEPAAVDRLRELREVRDAPQDQLYEAQANADATSVAVSVEDWDLLTLDEQRALIRAVIERVIVSPGRGAGRITIEPRT